MDCRVIVGGFKLNKQSTDTCYLLKTEVLGWVDWLGWCTWIGWLNCNGFIDSEVMGDHRVQRWRLCPGETSLLIIMHRKTCNETFHVEVVLLCLSKDGKLTSKVVTNAMVNPKDVNKFLDKLTKRVKPRDFNCGSH